MVTDRPPASTSNTPIRFQFTGSGKEYFRIWIVNIFLTLLTLGIYSAWAKVRRNRYFYNHTRLGNASFEYLANPLLILKGRLLAAAVFVVYLLAGAIWQPLQILMALALLAALPWVIVKSLLFRARNTAYRNVRFNFTGRYGQAFVVYILLPIGIIFTLGLLYPYVAYRRQQFVVTHSAFGQSPFSFNAKIGEFYKMYLMLLLFLIGIGLLVMVAGTLHPVLAFPAALPAYLYFFAYMGAATANLTYNGSHLGEHGFHGNLRPGGLFKLYFVNLLGIVFTLGLFIPWAKVRLARYFADHIEFVPVGDLDGFINATVRSRVGSAGEEVGEMFDIDVGL